MTARHRGRPAGGKAAFLPTVEHSSPSPPASAGIHDPTGETFNQLDGQPPKAVQGSNYKPYDGT